MHIGDALGVPVPPATTADDTTTPARHWAWRGSYVWQYANRKGTGGLCVAIGSAGAAHSIGTQCVLQQLH